MKRLLTPGWLACHGLVLVLIAGMLGMAGWQLSRAAGGNGMSWGYVAQWPVFAGFVGFVWWREARRVLGRDPASEPASGPGTAAAAPGPTAPAPNVRGREVPASEVPVRRRPVITRPAARAAGGYADRDDPDLAAYNRYLAWLNENPGARAVDYPG